MNLKEIEQIHNRDYNEIIKNSTKIQEKMREVLSVHLSENELENFDKRRQDDFILERSFFTDIFLFLRKKYNIPDIVFFPSSTLLMPGIVLVENDYILNYSKKFQQTLCDICVLTSFLFFEDDNDRLSADEERRLKNIFIGYIDTYANCGEMPVVNETIEKIYKAESAILGSAMARGILAFILCHEIAHVIINPTLKEVSCSEEFQADKLGCQMYFELLLSKKTFGTMRLDPSMNRAPLLLMDLLDLIDDYMLNITHKPVASDSSHPPAEMRKCYLLNSFLFQCDKDSCILYQFFYEQWMAIKAHLYINIENIVANIKAMSV